MGINQIWGIETIYFVKFYGQIIMKLLPVATID